MNYKEQFVYFLLESGTLTFGDFTLKSGRKSPYMVNTGKFDTGTTLSRLGCFYAKAIYEKMELGVIPDDATILFGSAYKGIPLASAASIALAAAYDYDIGYAFNRKEPKDHGEGGVFVGKKPGPGDKILVIDDVMTSGKALRETVELIDAYAPDSEIIGSVIAVDRNEHGKDARLSAVAEVQYELGFPIFSIVNIDEIVSMLKSSDFVRNMQKSSRKDEKGAMKTTCIGLSCDMCEREYESDMPLILPTSEQIAAIETYLKANRPSNGI